MKRISVVLKTSDVTAVRKALPTAGGTRVVITPMPRRVCAVELVDWLCGTPLGESDDHVRLDVTVDDSLSDRVISAILATAHVGKIENVALVPAKAGSVSVRLARRAA